MADPPPYDDHETQLPQDKSQWTEWQVSEAVRGMGPSPVWADYAALCLTKHLDGRSMCEAAIEDLVELQFQKIHARAVLHFFQPSLAASPTSSPSSSVTFHLGPESEKPASAQEKKGEFSFSHAVHIYSPPPTDTHLEQARRLKEDIAKTEVYRSDPFAPHFCDDATVHRFLRARQYDYGKAYALLLETLQWRASYRPQDILGKQLPNTGKTGKVFSHPIRDKWGRPILVLNNTKENCKDWDENIRWLTFQLERARKAMEIDHHRTGAVRVEKWVVFIHLTEFSFWNNPPWKVTTETLKLFTSRYPEHLGHAILFEAPPIFSGLFSLCTPFLDEVTKNKVVWIKGDCLDGQKNDLIMNSLIGPEWKTITGAFQAPLSRDSSPGFHFDRFWEGLLHEEKQWWALHRAYATRMGGTCPIEGEEEKKLPAVERNEAPSKPELQDNRDPPALTPHVNDLDLD